MGPTTSDGTWTLTHDAQGNVTKRSKGTSSDTWVYTFDNRNQMVWAEKRATDGGTLLLRADYKYDVYGRRVEEAVDSNGDGTVDSTTRFAYDGANVWVANSGSGTVSEINTTTNHVSAAIRVGDLPTGMVFDGRSIWVTDTVDDTLTKINPITKALSA